MTEYPTLEEAARTFEAQLRDFGTQPQLEIDDEAFDLRFDLWDETFYLARRKTSPFRAGI